MAEEEASIAIQSKASPVMESLTTKRAGLNDGLFSETMDFFRQSWLYRLYYPLCVSRRIDNWHIVYLSNKDPCPKILVHKSEIKVP